MSNKILHQTKLISLADITQQAERAMAMMEQIRSAMLAPSARKSAPTFSLTQLAAALDVEKGSVSHRMGKGDLPAGRLNAKGSRREFTLAEVRTWARDYRKDKLRPPGAEAVTERIASGEDGDGTAFRQGRLGPMWHRGQSTVHVVANRFATQMRTNEVERAAGPDDDAGVIQMLPRGIGESAPAVVKNADQGATAHNASSSSTRTMNSPSKSQTSTVRAYAPG